MEERRSLLEWIFDALAAVGLLWLLIGLLAREPLDALSSVIWWGMPAGLFIGGVLASQWRKNKRLSALMHSGRDKASSRN